jgi:hypothetical protein
MWQDIQWNGDDNWIAEAIQDGTCIVVTDGSYMKTLYPVYTQRPLFLSASECAGACGDCSQRSAGILVATEENSWDYWRFILFSNL